MLLGECLSHPNQRYMVVGGARCRADNVMECQLHSWSRHSSEDDARVAVNECLITTRSATAPGLRLYARGVCKIRECSKMLED